MARLFFMDRSRPGALWRIGIISSDGGAIRQRFNIPKTLTSRLLAWTPDGGAVTYVNDIGGVSNIWMQPVAGESQPRQLTRFQSERITAFDWSPDGKYLALARTNESSYVALIRDPAQRP